MNEKKINSSRHFLFIILSWVNFFRWIYYFNWAGFFRWIPLFSWVGNVCQVKFQSQFNKIILWTAVIIRDNANTASFSKNFNNNGDFCMVQVNFYVRILFGNKFGQRMNNSIAVNFVVTNPDWSNKKRKKNINKKREKRLITLPAKLLTLKRN